MSANTCEVLVIGEGLSGMMAAAAAATHGLRVMLVSKGPGNFVLGSTCIDVEGMSATKLALTDNVLKDAVDFFISLTASADSAYNGGLREHRIVPTILGTFQEVSLAPRSLWQADPRNVSKVLIVGFDRLSGFAANFLADRLSFHSREMGLKASYRSEIIPLLHSPRHAVTALEIASHIDRDDAYRTTLANALRPVIRDAELLIIPGILGVKSNDADLVCFEEDIGCAVCELATLPPSVPGLRLLQRLEQRLTELGVEISTGFAVRKLCTEGDRCVAVELDTPGRARRLTADHVVLACGKFAEFLEPAAEASVEYSALTNVSVCGSLLLQPDPRHRNAVSMLSGYHAGMLASEQGVQYAGR